MTGWTASCSVRAARSARPMSPSSATCAICRSAASSSPSAPRTTRRMRSTQRGAATDLEGYLRSLDMALRWRRFDTLGQARIVQLINKTNQFNLTTRRIAAEEVAALIADPRALTLQIRLLDQFGDNGVI